jgi:uncharacterized protein YjbI with pentapeptide repeats
MWWRYWPNHDVFGSCLMAVCLWVSGDAGTKSFLHALEWFESVRPKRQTTFGLRVAGWIVSLCIGGALIFVTLAKTGAIDRYVDQAHITIKRTDGLLTMSRADLTDVQLVEKPETWQTYNILRRNFRRKFCQIKGLQHDVCGSSLLDQPTAPLHQPIAREKWAKQYNLNDSQKNSFFAELENGFRAEWRTEFGRQIALLPKIDLEKRDLRAVLGWGLFMNGADLTEANFQAGWLPNAQFQGASLESVRFQEANLENAAFQGAFLRTADFWGAQMVGATFQGANLIGADFHDTDITNANFQDTTFKDVRQVWSAIAHGADFRGANGLTQNMLKNVIGDDTTLLYSNEGHVLNVWSCLEDFVLSPHMESMMRRANFRNRRSVVRKDWICSDDNPRRAVGTTLHPDAPRPN